MQHLKIITMDVKISMLNKIPKKGGVHIGT